MSLSCTIFETEQDICRKSPIFLTPPTFRTLLGISPKFLHHKSGPCTLACSVGWVTVGSVALAQYQRMKDRETEMPQQYRAIAVLC